MSEKLAPATAEQLRQFDLHLNGLWDLGRNSFVAWTPDGTTVRLLVAPFYRLLQVAPDHPRLLRGTRHMPAEHFALAQKALEVEPLDIRCGFRVGGRQGEVPWQTLERLIRRYAITEIAHRGVFLLDITGFSRLTSIEQIGQLNALEYSLNSAQRRLQDRGVRINLARSTTGDGFYVWNREQGLMADVYLFAAMALALADNALARSKDQRGLVPVLRTAYSVGRHFSYHQIDGLAPRAYDYIVGDVTIYLARLIEKAAPGQTLIGDFARPASDQAAEPQLDSMQFLDRALATLKRLVGIQLGGVPVTDVKLFVTGRRSGEGGSATKYDIRDKHGFVHSAFNLTLAVERGGAPPLHVGLQSGELDGFARVQAASAEPAAS